MALDPNLFFYADGTITLTNGSDIATGDLVAWDVAVLPFDFIFPNDGTDGMSVVKEVLAVNQIRLAKPWTGPTLTTVPYFMVRWVRHTDPRVYALRVSDYLARLKGIPENFEEIGQQVAADAAAVASALATITQAASDVEADRQAVDTAAAAVASDAAVAATARDEAEAARDVAVSAAGSTAALWDSRAAAVVATIPAEVQYLRTAGYATAGDGGGALYRRLGAAPSPARAWHFQSADGAWWELASSDIYVEMFGALGNGADDKPGIQAGIDYIQSLAWGGELKFSPKKTYLIGSQVTVPVIGDKHVVLTGYGAMIRPYGSYTGALFYLGQASLQTGGMPFFIRGLDFRGTFGSTTNPVAIKIEYWGNATIEDCYFSSFKVGVQLTNSYAMTFRRCMFHHFVSGSFAFQALTSCMHTTFDGCAFYDCHTSLRFEAETHQIEIDQCDFEGGVNAIQFLGATGGTPFSGDAIRIEGCYIEGITNLPIYFAGLARGVSFRGNWLGYNSGTQTWYNIDGGVIEGNKFWDQAQVVDATCKNLDIGFNAWSGSSNRIYPPMTAPTFLNGFSNKGGAYAPVGYRQLADGTVVLQGTITGTADNVAFTLPQGMRPQADVRFICDGASSTLGRVVISTGGSVTVYRSSDGSLCLDGVRFTARA